MGEHSYNITIPQLNERWDMPEELVNKYWSYMKGMDAKTRNEKYLVVQEEWYNSLSAEDQQKIKKSKAY